ncbi:kinase-like domain-containing protein [Zychaea mexicana]|uniref:kinase-like domain-containing protein n=1 Tax=Zychaea mexicana TaxID=64656 RepID=UPI0022FEAF14|nr:kinase-like domain-containing protein [Zychaea mexicana]KAI9494190.1 kinase-like domain-containing protein [Zychaea mexicana]
MIHPLAQEQQQESSYSTCSHHQHLQPHDNENNDDVSNYHAGTTTLPPGSSNTAVTAVADTMSEKINELQQQQEQEEQQHHPPRPTSDAFYDHHPNQLQQQQQHAFYAPQSPELPFPRIHQQQPQPQPQQRAYSVTAMPSELQRAVLRHQQQLAEQRQQQLMSAPDQPWWQYYYQLYHYHPPPGRKPTVFGPYLLLQTLGEGEFGKVKLGIHIETGQEVAIKLIKKDNIDSSTRMSKVEREISVLRKVRHPYIVKLYDVIETERYIGIILQCASGGELFEYILAHRYLKEKDASRLFAQLISGVHYMHQKHIVHRDLKLYKILRSTKVHLGPPFFEIPIAGPQ